MCLPETEKGCSGHASVIDSQFRLPLPFCLFCFSSTLLRSLIPSVHFSSFLFCRHTVMKPGWSERNIGKTVYLSWPLQIVSGRIASSGGDNCHLHNLMAIYDICFSLAAGRNAAQAVTAGKTMLHRTENCRKEHKNQDSFHKAKNRSGLSL